MSLVAAEPRTIRRMLTWLLPCFHLCSLLDVLCRFPSDVAAQGEYGLPLSSSLCGSLYISITFFIAHCCLLEANAEGYL